ncbi:MAG TPA: DUF481 domain-containing protein [Terracidiphilus sp.]|jgi:hypothetical protein
MFLFAEQAPFRFLSSRMHLLLAVVLTVTLTCVAQTKPAADPDVLVLKNGDTLHGKFVSAVGGKVNFHSDPLGDISVAWENVKELHTAGNFAVLDSSVKQRGKKHVPQIPIGKIDFADQAVTVHPESGPTPSPVAAKNAAYVVDQPTLDKEVYHHPSLAAGWNGAATAGATLVAATQNQYTFSGAVGLLRVVPTVDWLDPRNRTSVGFTGSYGKITQPAYLLGDVLVPATITKSAIFHAEAERDEYFAPRFFALAQVAYDHNFAQNLQLQQIYGGGLGWTFLKTEKQMADVKATVQYERQAFIGGTSATNENLIGSTFSLDYLLHMKLLTYTQGIAYIPAYNNPRAYSVNETNTLAFPTYKNLSFSVGTLDSYLNNPPASAPPTKRNSFQFTMGLTYAIKSKY